MKLMGALDATGLWINGQSGIHHFPNAIHARLDRLELLFSLADAYLLRELWIHPSFHDVAYMDDLPGLWDIWPDKPDAPWYHGFRPGVHGDGIDIAFAGRDDRAAWGQAQNGEQLLAEVMAYNEALGFSYAWSPGHTGSKLLREIHSGRSTPRSPALRLDPPDYPPEPAILPKAPAREMAWIRALTEQEQQYGWLHSFDKNGAYLAVCGSLELGLGPWEYAPGQFLHKSEKVTIPGYWCVTGYDVPAGLPDVLDPDGYYAVEPEADVWVTTPALNAMLEHSAVEIEKSYTWPNHARVLASWQARMRDARTQLSGLPLALQTLKSTYVSTIGLFGGGVRANDRHNALYRPDWRHMIIGQSTANTWRRVVKAVGNGVSVAAVAADCIYVVSDLADPTDVAKQAGIRLGGDLSDCKVQDSVPLDSVRAFFNPEDMGGFGTRRRALEQLRKHLGSMAAGMSVEEVTI